MRALLQRVSSARVRVDGEVVGHSGPGLLVLLGVRRGDTEADAVYLVNKIPHLRLFPTEGSHFERSCLDVGGSVLVVSQFTLYAETRKGRRPSFTDAASPDEAAPLINRVVEGLRSVGLHVETGRFQALMQVELVNDGPVTILLDSSDRERSRRSAETGQG
ncbi:MAG: D-tyrosyl-tRNA(Tyr) deacylase [Chloroflexi bacterium]|nr:D-tyrosyl-tRNA(Tyr) deacylase [Chloroflexota bacterium]